MGLDMYAYKHKESTPKVDFEWFENAEELACWRKHPNLHGWMEALYRKNNGAEDCFNGVCISLDRSDLEELETAVAQDDLPATTGFFFGSSWRTKEERQRDLDFINKARAAIDDGYSVFYVSSW